LFKYCSQLPQYVILRHIEVKIETSLSYRFDARTYWTGCERSGYSAIGKRAVGDLVCMLASFIQAAERTAGQSMVPVFGAQFSLSFFDPRAALFLRRQNQLTTFDRAIPDHPANAWVGQSECISPSILRAGSGCVGSSYANNAGPPRTFNTRAHPFIALLQAALV
jgi:hypothetical protein